MTTVSIFFKAPREGAPLRESLPTQKLEVVLETLTDEQQKLIRAIYSAQNPAWQHPEHIPVAVRRYEAKVSFSSGPALHQDPLVFDHVPNLEELLSVLAQEWENREIELAKLNTMQEAWKQSFKHDQPMPSAIRSGMADSGKLPMPVDAFVKRLEDILADYYTDDDDDDGEVMAKRISFLLGEWHSSHK